MKKFKATLHLTLILLSFMFIISCSSLNPFSNKGKNKESKNYTFSMVVHAQANINPNINGNPSPIVINIYQLNNNAAFDTGDFFSLYSDAKNYLADDFVSQQQIVVAPNQTQNINFKLNPDTQYIGVLAAYSDINNKQWHTTYVINSTKLPKKLIINVASTKISIEESK